MQSSILNRLSGVLVKPVKPDDKGPPTPSAHCADTGGIKLHFAWQENFSARRHAAAGRKSDYDPGADDYEMTITPDEPGSEDAEKKLIQLQIASLASRISKGGQQGQESADLLVC